MDVDRLDYLRRDSRSAGVDYGLFDLDRLLGTLAGYVGGIVPVLSDKGLHIAEQYLLARYHMYWQVYYHKTTRGYERLLASVLARAVEVGELSGTAVDALLSDGSTLGAYLRADDADVVVALKQWATASDEVLADLARRCIDRDLFVCILRHDPSHRVDPISVARTATISRAREALRSRGLPEAYYLVEDTPAMATYGRYDTGREDGKPPVLIQGEGGARPVDEISDPIRSITRDTTAVRVYVPRQCAELLRDQ
jgi:HD superfamily phosphohydrolase